MSALSPGNHIRLRKPLESASSRTDNHCMTKTVVTQVWGTLEGGGKTYNVKLNLTVKELWADESMTPLDRVVTRAELSPMSGVAVQNGNYTLRYSFNGKQEEHAVRVEDGTLLSGVAA